MVKTSHLDKWLSIRMVEDNDVIKILTEADVSKEPRKYEPKLECNVLILKNNQEKMMSINNTSRRAFTREWGEDSKDWINKCFKVVIDEAPTGQKFIKGIPCECPNLSQKTSR